MQNSRLISLKKVIKISELQQLQLKKEMEKIAKYRVLLTLKSKKPRFLTKKKVILMEILLSFFCKFPPLLLFLLNSSRSVSHTESSAPAGLCPQCNINNCIKGPRQQTYYSHVLSILSLIEVLAAGLVTYEDTNPGPGEEEEGGEALHQLLVAHQVELLHCKRSLLRIRADF